MILQLSQNFKRGKNKKKIIWWQGWLAIYGVVSLMLLILTFWAFLSAFSFMYSSFSSSVSLEILLRTFAMRCFWKEFRTEKRG